MPQLKLNINHEFYIGTTMQDTNKIHDFKEFKKFLIINNILKEFLKNIEITHNFYKFLTYYKSVFKINDIYYLKIDIHPKGDNNIKIYLNTSTDENFNYQTNIGIFKLNKSIDIIKIELSRILKLKFFKNEK